MVGCYRCVYFWHRHAVGRRLRQRHAVHRGRRKYPHGADVAGWPALGNYGSFLELGWTRAARALGVSLQSLPYLADYDFERSLLSNVTTTTNVAIILGAMATAGLAGKFNPVWQLSWRGALTAVLGGLMMGYGGRMSFGCNIGAFFSGVASGSLHGWLWLVCGFTGSILGTYVRKLLGDGPYRSQ